MNNTLLTLNEKEIIWEEKDLTEHKTNCSDNNDFVQSVITNDTKPDSMLSLCNDIGEKERRRLLHNKQSNTYRLKYPDKIKQIQKNYYLKNPNKRKEFGQNYYLKNPNYNKDYYRKNKENLKSLAIKYYHNNKVPRKQYRTKNKFRIDNYNKQYYTLNKTDIIKYHTNHCNKRRMIDIKFRLAGNLRTRLTKAIRRNQKVGSAVKDLGCSLDMFKNYIASKFQDGMSWNNYGNWHLDHIIPISIFNLEDREQFLKACHYTNYQPLWRDDNIRKSNKFPNPHPHNTLHQIQDVI